MSDSENNKSPTKPKPAAKPKAAPKPKAAVKPKAAPKPEPTLDELKEDWRKERKARLRTEKLRKYMAKRDQEKK